MNTRQQRKESASDTRKDDEMKEGKQKDARGGETVDIEANEYLNESKPMFRAMEMQHMTEVQFQRELTPNKGDDYSSKYNNKQSLGKTVISSYPFFSHEEIHETWDVTRLTEVPEGYPVARTSFEICISNGLTIEEVSRIMYELLKERSIKAKYDNGDAIVQCKTRSFMKFTIRLFKGSGDNILIEIRRRSGCSLAFKEEYQSFFQALNIDEVPRKPSQRRMIKLEDMECVTDKIALPENIIEESLELCLNHLKSDLYDARMLALEDLVTTTDPSSTDIAPTACNLILQKYQEILKVALDIVQDTNDDNNDDDDEDDSIEYFRCMALTVVRNVGAVCSENETFVSMTHNDKDFVHHLIGNIKMAGKYPWNACVAMKCLSILMKNSDEYMLDICEEARYALENAKLIGQKSYASLEKEASEALGVIVG